MASSIQTLKSSVHGRVRTDQALRLGSQSRHLGEGIYCPAGAGDIFFDQYMRPVSQNTLHLNDSSCSNYTSFSARRRIHIENMERPYATVCSAGYRGGGGLMGAGRDLHPQDMYGLGTRGNMVRHYDSANNTPPSQGPAPAPSSCSYRTVQPFSHSHDATGYAWRG